MAKTKQDYISEGMREAEDHAARGLLSPHASYPVTSSGGALVAMNGSWQARAWKEGYDSVRWRVWQAVPSADTQAGDTVEHLGRAYRITAVFPDTDAGTAACNQHQANFPNEYAVLKVRAGQVICASKADEGTPIKRESIAPVVTTPKAADPLRDSMHAVGSHISQLRIMAAQDAASNPARAARLTAKANALLNRWTAKAFA